MSNLKELHHFNKLSISEGASGDIYAELDSGDTVLLLSASGSEESEHALNWYRSPDRTEADFDYDDLLAEAAEE